jgi:hypothetical protein
MWYIHSIAVERQAISCLKKTAKTNADRRLIHTILSLITPIGWQWFRNTFHTFLLGRQFVPKFQARPIGLAITPFHVFPPPD